MENSLSMGNNLNRRTFLFTASAVLSAPSLVLSSQTFEAEASREVLVIWRNMTIGSSNIRARRDQKKLKTEIDVKLVVKIFGITFYSYSLKNRELWEEGQLIKLNSEAQENKKKNQLSVHKKAKKLHLEGSKFSGQISENAATTSYFTSDFLLRKIWINTHNGKPLNVDFMASGEENISTFSGDRVAKKWVNSGDLDLSLFYDANGDWIGSSFPVRGEQATMILNKEKNSINDLWKKTLSQ